MEVKGKQPTGCLWGETAQHRLRHEGLSGVMRTFCIDLGTCNKELSICILRSALSKKLDLNHSLFFSYKELTRVKLGVGLQVLFICEPILGMQHFSKK